MKLKFKVLPVAVCIALLITGCGKTEKASLLYNEEDLTGISSEVVATASDSELCWDDENKCVLLKNNTTNSVWSTIPYEYMEQGGTSANVTSPINITVSDTDTLKTSAVKGSSGAVSQGRVIGEKIDNGVKVTYYFDNQQISIPVIYTLDKNELVITLDSKNIVEASHYKLLDVAIVPFLCSASNSEENYLFIPSYNGEIMYTNANTGGTRKYSAAVYGVDMAHLMPTPQEFESEIKMPVFAAKNGNNALFAIIENGAEHVTIEAEAGNDRTGWSAIWPKITVRGVDVIETQLPQATVEDISYVSELKINDDVKIRYIPLYEEKANYNGMAECYREYLLKNNLLDNQDKSSSPYSVTVYGGAQISKLFAGIPYKTTVALTDFKESLEIIKTLKENIGTSPEVQFIGYGESGINIGEVGGGFKNTKSLGSKKDLNNLLKYLKENEISYYFDYDIVRYNNASSGFSTFSDIAKTASGHRATLSTVDVALAGFTDDEYNLLTRNKLLSASQKLIKSVTKKEIKGVSLNTLGIFSYSDYTNEEYVAKSGFSAQAQKIVTDIKQKGIGFAASNPNMYSALLADSLFNMTEKSEYKALNLNVPFYQMVIGGNKSLYSKPVNTSKNPKEQIMLSAAYGLGLNFEVIGKYNVETDLSGYSLYGGVFDGQKDKICGYVKNYLDVFSKINGACITEYVMLSDQISKTVYSNGKVILANHTESTATTEDIVLEGYEYKVAEQ